MLAQISARGSLVSLPVLKVTTRLSVLSYHERISSRGFNWGANVSRSHCAMTLFLG